MIAAVYPSEGERAVRATVIGVVLGALLAALARSRRA
jgi:hypothetical protein